MSSTLSVYSARIPEGYVAEEERTPVPDVSILDRLIAGGVDLQVEQVGSDLQITVYSGDATVSLERMLRLLGSLDLEVVDQRGSVYRRSDGLICRLYDFKVVAGPSAAVTTGAVGTDAILDTLRALWAGRAEADRFNVLVLAAGLDWREVVLLRAYARFLRQTALPYGQGRIEAVLLSRPDIAAALVALFHAQFDPDRDGDSRQREIETRSAVVDSLLHEVEGLDADRIVRAYVSLISATTRTNFYRDEALGSQRPQLSLKLRSEDIDELPRPRPLYEIFVYSPDIEGVHLRYGLVARGGLRWSDRLDDYRTEILGLVKAQAVKNAVIVPAGAKGGFVVKNPARSGVGGYRQFISGLLDVTDNRTATGEPIHPNGVVCRDGDDSYLVVAADKGTASFSDVANAIAAEYGFWLGDAFASGGSVGYDHKKMGITAKGAWVSVTRHLAELGIDVDHDAFTVAGIGDMSGDVFGNGMLLSEHIHLVAAFDHRHIFLDPRPDAASSYRERRRLFELPRSTWADYDRDVISAGGGVWSRESKAIPLSPQMRTALGLDSSVTTLTPPEVIRAILAAPVDLLFNGGVGTYVKSSTETHTEVGDKANDSVRIDAPHVRARVVTEGGNLGITPLARIEFARCGGRINTDALDNSAGVDCSDREVNIKILLDVLSSDHELDGERRAEVLASLTDDVAELVLANNRSQNRILGDARWNASRMIDVHARMLADLVENRGVDRELEALPSVDGFAALAEAGQGLTSPELATLLAHAKLDLKAELGGSDVFDDDYFTTRLAAYFPAPLRALVPVDEHPLRREILATEVVNEIFARGGLTYAHRLREETGASPADVVRAFVITSEVFGLADQWAGIVAAKLPPATEYALVVEARRLLDRGSRWFLANPKQPLSVDEEIARYRSTVHTQSAAVAHWLRGAEGRAMEAAFQAYREAGVQESVARRVADGLYRFSLLDIVDVAAEQSRDVTEIAPVYFALSDHLGVDKWLIRISALPRGERWHTLARLALRDDLYRSVRLVTRDVLTSAVPGDTPEMRIEQWQTGNHARIDRARRTLSEIDSTPVSDLASLSVAARHIRSMAEPH
ncbi:MULTISPECIES: NAD-glutamate dehydrogenase domain-containing protein [unclassified Rhodococcus (in: high G+C Gram-positive bacteria)]|uniref:NAD-glutamate dehydrogenase domain-containing protein n=1 Tax=unclassified Rhodococcus (in: high G+C Gram-positive bacteria) TaxID=192944 RepID=UPI00163A7CF3|nr:MULTISPECIES: NAD-glutamate dehydrogenase domain-containing protein [unclassified Rhodococcus (in: high G+C Gram-positive bacteria)]MBC2640828.1 NAD-glutamate dehydrogenase [Rhodococcus sp. 3A]MBC2894428.1 NAD-glutamate dehydrogenase [Rhodococcus sp. 4CII]